MKAWIGLLAVAAACGDQTIPGSTEGARLFADPALLTGPLNTFACSTCHAVTVDPTPAGGPIYAGANLFDSVHRPSWWGGGETRLLDAISYCYTEFMGGGVALDENDDRARALYEYLDSVSPDSPSPAIPLTVVKNITDLAPLAAQADAGRGEIAYQQACVGCHGAPHTGDGRLGSLPTIVPEDTLDGPVCGPVADPAECARTVTVEKIRHGRFFNIGGVMPLYSAERISDAQIADILAYLGL